MVNGRWIIEGASIIYFFCGTATGVLIPVWSFFAQGSEIRIDPINRHTITVKQYKEHFLIIRKHGAKY